MADAALHAANMIVAIASNPPLNFAFAAAVTAIDNEAKARQLDATGEVMQTTSKKDFFLILAKAAEAIPANEPNLWVGEIAPGDLDALPDPPGPPLSAGDPARMMWTVLKENVPLNFAFSATVTAADAAAKLLEADPSTPDPTDAKVEFYRALAANAATITEPTRWV